MIKTTFKVQTSPIPHIGALLRAADLGDGVIVAGDYTYITVTWKKGEIVDENRTEKAKMNIKIAYEKLGYDCYSVEVLQRFRR